MLDWLRHLHRDEWRDALRLGLQSAVAAALAWLAAEGSGDLEHFLVIMMAVTSLQRTVGGTIGQALMRLQSAVAGSVIGFLALALLPAGWGTAVALGAALFVVGVVTALRSSWQLAVVPAVGMSLEGKTDLLHTAVVSSGGIFLGAAIGTAVSLLLWPERAEARFERHFARALRATATRLTDAVEATLEPGRAPRVAEHVTAWEEAVWLAAEALSEARFVDRAAFERRLAALRDLKDSVVILDRAAEAADPPLSPGPMRDQVARLRREACAALLGLSEGRREGARMAEIDALLAGMRTALEAEDARAPGHELHAAVAFGLREVRRTLLALARAQDPAEGPAPAPAHPARGATSGP